MAEARVLLAWVLAVVMLVLLFGSLTGQGTGLLGLGLLRGMAWSYAIVGVLLLVLVGFARPREVNA